MHIVYLTKASVLMSLFAAGRLGCASRLSDGGFFIVALWSTLSLMLPGDGRLGFAPWATLLSIETTGWNVDNVQKDNMQKEVHI